MQIIVEGIFYFKNRFLIRSFQHISSSHVTVQIQQSRALFSQGPFGSASKIESGKMKLEFAPVSLGAIAENMQSLFAPLAKQKNLNFSINIDDNAPTQLVTDTLRLEQILKNLLNHIKIITIKIINYLKLELHLENILKLCKIHFIEIIWRNL